MERTTLKEPSVVEALSKFNVYPVFYLPDYNELFGRTAWGRIRDRFYDPAFHGADWPALKAKYVPAFRHATSHSVRQRVAYMMLGELDASHLGFFHSKISRNEWEPSPFGQNWKPVTGHLGLRFDPSYKGPGWRVRDVLRGGPADKAVCGIRAGDIVTRVNGKDTSPALLPADLLSTHDKLKATFTFGHPGEPATNVVSVNTITYSDARDLVREEKVRAARRRAHELSGGRV